MMDQINSHNNSDTQPLGGGTAHKSSPSGGGTAHNPPPSGGGTGGAHGSGSGSSGEPSTPETFLLGSQTGGETTSNFGSEWLQNGVTITTTSLPSSTVAETPVTTTVNSNNFNSVLTVESNGIGVSGNTTPGNSSPNGETGYDPVTHQSEALTLNFSHDVNSAQLGLANFFDAASGVDQNQNEAMEIQLYDNGKLVGSSEIVANGTVSNTQHFSATDSGNGNVTATVNGITFDKVVLSALPYDSPSSSTPNTSGQGSITVDSSDFSLQYVSGTYATGGGTAHNPPPSGGGTAACNPPLSGGGTTTNQAPVAVNVNAMITVDHYANVPLARPTDRSPVFDANQTLEALPANPISGNVLTNDSDPHGYALAVTSTGTFDLTYGILVINANGSFTYTVDTSDSSVINLPAGNTLTDAFTYNISDGHGGTASATLDISIGSTVEYAPKTIYGLDNVAYNNLQGEGDNILIGGNNVTTNEIHAESQGNDILYGGDGVGTHNYMIGGSEATNDMYGGNNGAINNMYGGGGNQWMFGGQDATNNIWGGGGNDKIVGGDNSTNTIYGGSGNDTITGGNHSTNIIYTETGTDIVQGGTYSTNTIYGGPEANQITGGIYSTNIIYGGGGNDTIIGGNDSTNVIYGGGGNDIITGGDASNNTYYAEWGTNVTITGGNNADNTFYDGAGNDTYIGGAGDNFFIFNDFKYPLGSQGVQGNTTVPVALANQAVTSGFQFISGGTDTVHGNTNSSDNVVELKGAPASWTITVSDPASGIHNATDGGWTALTGQTLQGTITSSVNGAVVTFDHINQIKFIA